jgi:hypothetical protein
MTSCPGCGHQDCDFFLCPNCGREYPAMDWLNVVLTITLAFALLCLAALYRLER